MTWVLQMKKLYYQVRRPIHIWRPQLKPFLLQLASTAGSKELNPFHFCKIRLEQSCIYRNGLPVDDSPINNTDEKRLYFNRMSGLAYIDNGHGNNLSEYPSHFIMVFDLISTQQASLDFIHPEITNCSISIELKFSAALPSNIEVFNIGEKVSTIFIDSARKISKKSYSDKLMDEDEINSLVQAYKLLSTNFVVSLQQIIFP